MSDRGVGPLKRDRIRIFLQKLENAPSARDYESGLLLMRSIMRSVEDAALGPRSSQITDSLRVPEWKHGWENMSGDPRRWDDTVGVHRTSIYRNGRILIEKRVQGGFEIVLDKAGS